jgi:hypothetical protein
MRQQGQGRDLMQLPLSDEKITNEEEAQAYLNKLFNTAAKSFETIYSRSLEIQEKYEGDEL